MDNMREDIIQSYQKLIYDCQINIDNNNDIDKNELLIKEYKYVLKQVESKSQKEYDELSEKIKEFYLFSKSIYETLSSIIPAQRYNNIKGKV